jgi:hypothetical protein
MSADSPSTWGSSDAHETLVHTNATINRKIRSAWTGFLNFALRDNVLEVAVGLMYVLWSLSSLFFVNYSLYLQNRSSFHSGR